MTSIKIISRFFFRELGSSLLAVVVLAIGLSLSITMFSMVNGIIWSSPDVGSSGEIVQVVWHREANEKFNNGINIRDIRYIQSKQTSFSHLEHYQWWNMVIYSAESDRPAKKYNGSKVSVNFLPMVNAQPLMGRQFTKEDVSGQSTSVVIISHSMWQDFFGGRTDVLGKYLDMNGSPNEVIGVMPKEFQFPNENDFWVVSDYSNSDKRPRSKAPKMPMTGVLKPGVSQEQALTELENLASILAAEYPDTNKNRKTMEIRTLNEAWTGSRLPKMMYLLLAGSLLVLLSASANVSNLILARSSKRQHELAVRKSLGASSTHLINQILLDTAVLALIGFVLSLILSNFICTYLWDIYEKNWFAKPYWWHLNIDLIGYIFAFVLALAAMLLSGLVVALRVVRSTGTLEILKDDSRTSSGLFIGKFARVLVGVQITLSTILLIVGISMISYTKFMTERGLSYNPYGVLTTWIQAFKRLGLDSDAQVYGFYNDITENVRAIPGVNDVTYSFGFGGYYNRTKEVEVEGYIASREEEKVRVAVNIVAENYFEFYDFEPISGRTFETTDIKGNQFVAVIDKNFSDKFYPRENPLGKRIRVNALGDSNGNNKKSSNWSEWAVIVGVVPNMRGSMPNWDEDSKNQLFVSNSQILSRGMSILVKGEGDMSRYISPLRRALSEDIPQFSPMSSIQTLGRIFERSDAYTTILTKIIVSFGLAALFMAAAGLYGLISFTTQLKQKEIGIRKALGAPDAHILQLMLSYSKWQILIGCILGCAVSVAICRQLFSLLSPNVDFFSLAAFPLGLSVIALVAILAILIPSFRAAQRPPSETLLER